MPLRRVKGKLLKGSVMRKHPALRRHLPVTRRFRLSVVKRMIRRYPTLFIKPDKGSQGRGIVRLKRLVSRRIQVSWGRRHRKVRRRYVGRTLKRLMRPRTTYLVQQGIKLAKYKNRLIDIRVFMQKPKSSWHISGKVVRVGASGKFVTNYNQGARPETLEKVLAALYKNRASKIKRTIRRIESISATTAVVLDRKFPGIRQLGIDIGLDRNGRLWVIEANTNPAFMLFKTLKDKAMYRRIAAWRRLIRSKYR